MPILQSNHLSDTSVNAMDFRLHCLLRLAKRVEDYCYQSCFGITFQSRKHQCWVQGEEDLGSIAQSSRNGEEEGRADRGGCSLSLGVSCFPLFDTLSGGAF